MADSRVEIEATLDTKNAEKEASSFGKSLSKNIGNGAKSAVKGVAAIGTTMVAAGGMAVGALTKMATATAQTGDHIDKMSQKIGMSAEAYQKWDYVAKISGTSIDGLKMGFKTLTNTIDSANKGNKEAVEKFQQVGVSMDDLKNKSREQIFEDTIKGLQNMSDETERSALANKLLGRAGMELGPMLNSTNADLEKLMKTAEEYGMIMSDEAVKASAKFQDSVTTMQMTMQGMKNRMMAEFLPALTQVTDGLALLFKGDTKDGIAQMEEGITEFSNKIIEILPNVLKIGGSILKAIGQSIIDNLPVLLETGIEIMQGLLSALISAIPAIAEQIPLLLKTLFTALTENTDSILDGVLSVLEVVGKSLVESLPVLIDGLLNLILALADWLANNSDKVIRLGFELIEGLLQGLFVALPKLIRALPKLIKSLLDSTIKNLPLIIQGTIRLIEMIVKNLPTIIVELVKAIPLIFVEIVKAMAGCLQMLVTGFVNLVKNVVANGPKIVSSIYKKIPVFIKNLIIKFLEIREKIINVGKNIVTGIWEGIKSAGKWLWDKIKGFCGDIVDGFCDFLGIGSPSKVMRDEVGYWMGEGIYEGFKKSDPMNQIEKDLNVGVGQLNSSIALSMNPTSIGNAVSQAVDGLTVSVDGRSFGRIIRSY